MKKKLLIIIGILLIVLLIFGIWYIIDKNKINNNEPTNPIASTTLAEGTDVILSLEDTITNNSVWCGTFNLIWNDLKNDLAKQDIVFKPQLEVVENLNKGTFTTNELSEDSYYKKYGTPSIELKEEIENAIKEKFNETSDILNDFNWNDTGNKDYFLYAMLKKEFEFPKEFAELKDGNFGNYSNVKYFGIDNTTSDEVRNQVEVLYYNSKEDFAIKLITKGDDEVIISRGSNGNTFKDIYDEIEEKADNYEGNKEFAEEDTLKVPNITFDLKEEFKELEAQPFEFSNGDIYEIETALQTIKFKLDKKGGEIKSEAGMMVRENAIATDEPREFLVDDTFTIFLKENSKELPYFAAKISDISSVQSDVNKN